MAISRVLSPLLLAVGVILLAVAIIGGMGTLFLALGQTGTIIAGALIAFGVPVIAAFLNRRG